MSEIASEEEAEAPEGIKRSALRILPPERARRARPPRRKARGASGGARSITLIAATKEDEENGPHCLYDKSERECFHGHERAGKSYGSKAHIET